MNELIYDEKTGLFWWAYKRQGRQMDRPAGHRRSDGYIEIQWEGKHYLAQRLAWLFNYGVWPTYEADHDNRVRHDNRIENLRDHTRSQNAHNTPVHWDKTSGLPKGIDMRDGNYRVRVQIRGRRKELSGLQTLKVAIRWRDKWLEEL